MRKMLFFAVVFLSISAAVANAAPVTDTQPDETFIVYYDVFREAVRTGDRHKVADLTDFEKYTWEANEDFRVKNRETFLENYSEMFTAAIKSRIETAEPVKIDDNSWFITWRAQGSEYSLHFYRKGKGGFKFSGLAVGPY